MKTKPNTLLLHPFFLLSLLLLLLNDAFFKHQYHNWLTGKLSDFAGLFAFAVFTIAILPNRKTTILLLISIVFIWWKSPLSEPFIFYVNNQLHFPFHRIVDYSDYIALAILPIACYLRPIHYYPSLSRQIAIGCICFISFSAFTATSLPRRLSDGGKVRLDKNVKTKKTPNEVVEALYNKGLELRKDSAFDSYYIYGEPHLKVKDSSGKEVFRPLDRYGKLYTKVEGYVYTIPAFPVGNDTIYDFTIVITNPYNKSFINLRDFNHKAVVDSNLWAASYPIYRKLKKPIKKKIKEIVK